MKKPYKKQTVSIKLSSTFLSRTKCKYCKDFSPFMYRIRNPTLHKSVGLTVKRFEFIRKNLKRMCEDYYLDFNPRIFQSNSLFTHDVSYKGYNPRMHRLRNAESLSFTEYVSCECGMTDWAINYKSNEKQSSSNKRTNKNYPKKFIY